MRVDAATLLLQITLLDTTLAMLMLFYGSYRKAFPGFWQWTSSALVFGVAHGMLLAPLVLPPSYSVLVASTALCFAVLLRLDGTLVFSGHRSLPRLSYLGPLAMGVAMLVMFNLGIGDAVRNTITSLYIATVAAGCALACFRADGEGRLLFRTAGVTQTVMVVALLVRIVLWLQAPENRLTDPSTFQGVFFSLDCLNEVCLAAAFVPLNSLRVESELAQANRQVEAALAELESTMAGLKILRGLLSICSYCKNIRVAEDQWERVEVYVRRHSEADFSHGICPKCLSEHFPETAQRLFKKPEEP